MIMLGQSRESSRRDIFGGQENGASHGTRSQARQGQSAKVNVGEAERAVSFAAGSILTLLGLRRASLPGLLIAGVGGALAYRGATGHCPAYAELNLNTARRGSESGSGASPGRA